MRNWILGVCSFVLVSWATSVSAATMIPGVSINAYSSQFSASRGASLLIDGSGLSSDPVTFTPSPTGPYHFGAGENRHWHTSNGDVVGAFVTFDLGAVVNFDEIRVWNHNWTNYTFRGINAFNVDTSLDGVTFSPLGSFALAAASGADNYTGELFSVVDTTRYVRFTVVSAQLGNDGYVGLSEVQFFDIPVAPEPSSLLLFGLGTCLLTMKRRRNSQQAAQQLA